jgi:hypothetical protein
VIRSDVRNKSARARNNKSYSKLVNLLIFIENLFSVQKSDKGRGACRLHRSGFRVNYRFLAQRAFIGGLCLWLRKFGYRSLCRFSGPTYLGLLYPLRNLEAIAQWVAYMIKVHRKEVQLLL